MLLARSAFILLVSLYPYSRPSNVQFAVQAGSSLPTVCM
jgi:hypothetical protein